MVEKTVSCFLGIFLFAFPFYVFLSVIVLRGLDWLMEEFKGDLKQNIFHHHYHYKAKR